MSSPISNPATLAAGDLDSESDEHSISQEIDEDSEITQNQVARSSGFEVEEFAEEEEEEEEDREPDSLDSSTSDSLPADTPVPPTNFSPVIESNVSRPRAFLKRQLIRLLYCADRFAIRMILFVSRYHKELFLLFIFLASGLTLRSLKTQSPPPPNPFYQNSEPYVQDNYQGEYFDIVRREIPFSPSFIFYYATWDSESVAARPVFLALAKYFHKAYNGKVKFFAVNCWWPEGQCRKNYKNLSHFPIFVAHINGQSGIIYNGPIRTEMMIKFLKSLLMPLTRIDNEEELWSFRAKHDAIMLSLFNFTDTESALNYETYYQMASRNFESDPFRQVGFAILLNKELGERFFLTSSNAVSLVLFNEIHTAKWFEGYNVKGMKGPVGQVVDWVSERTVKNPITWATEVRNGFANRGSAIGPIDLAQELKKGPVLLLITKRHYPSAYSPFYASLKEVALDYLNCNHSGNVTRLRRIIHKENAEWIDAWRSSSKRVPILKESLSHYENISHQLNFTGYICRSKKKFRFFAIDPTDAPHFINLAFNSDGLREGTKFVDPQAYIIEANREIVIPLKSFNISEIAIAIHNYSRGSLTSPNRLWVETIDKESPSEEEDSRASHVVKFNSQDLLNYVENKGDYNATSLLLLYTSKFCGYCGSAMSHFIRLASFITTNYNLNMTFAKLDVFKNSLPPHLVPDRIPSFVYMENNVNGTESRVFSMGDRTSTKNLLRFLLSQITTQKRVESSLQSPLCNGSFKIGNRTDTLMNLTNGNCISRNKANIENRIDSLLHVIRENSQSFEDINSNSFLWKNELLNHLRSLKLNLDIL